jgi:dihydrofolate synthase/folylpolyglutamate synthase
VQGSEISKREVVELVQEIKPYTEKVPGLTTYELITTLAFMHFARQNLDCAVIEVGLGGRLDATNVITPLVSVITSISYDHMHLLGNSLSDIAFEKAGIIKPEVPVIISPQQYEVKGVLTAIAKERGAPLYQVGKDWLFSHGRHDMNGQSLYLWSVVEQPLMTSFVESAGTEEWVPPRYEIPLLGYHQVINAATAYGALRIINKLGLKVDDRDIRSGFRQVSWPGRFQVLSKKPTLIVDSAHNRDSALKLRIALDDYFPGQPIKLIFGASADKDISGMLTELLPRVSRMIVTQADHPRAMTPEQLAELAHGYGIRLKEVVPVSEALNLALRNSYEDEVILATGSIFVVGEVLSAWKQIKESAESQIASGVR